MVHQEPFAVEQFMDTYETAVDHNMGETCVDSLTLNDIFDMAGTSGSATVRALTGAKLTYGHIQGSPQLRAAIAGLYDGAAPEDVVVTNGAIGANFLAFYSLVHPADHVVVVAPSYQQLSSVPRVFGANVQLFDISMESGYAPDLARLRAVFAASSTRLLVINNPNNPTGYVWENAVLQSIVDLCREYAVTIMCDEVYRPLFHFTPQEPVKSIVDFGYDNVVASGSMSKAFSLAGLRLGWLVSRNPTLVRGFLEKRDYNTISVSVLDDLVATLALQNSAKILARNHAICKTNLDLLERFVADHSDRVEWVRPRGSATCFLRLKGIVATQALAEDLARRHRVLVVPGEVFGMPGWLRIGFGNSTANIVNGLARLSQVLAEEYSSVLKEGSSVSTTDSSVLTVEK